MSLKPQSDSDSVCNAESDLVSRPILLDWLARQRSTIRHLQSVTGLHAQHPTKSGRERWEITQAKLLAIDDLADFVRSLPESSWGKNPILSSIRSAHSTLQRASRILEINLSDSRNPHYDADRDRLNMILGGLDELSSLIDKFSGNAGEQPEPARKAPESIGKSPVTAPGPSSRPDPGGFSRSTSADSSPLEEVPPPDAVKHWMPDYSVSELLSLSEAVLEELDSRPDSPTWGVS